MPKTIFISHSTLDDAQIDTIATALEATGHTVWVDHRNGITPNDSNWDKTIRKAIAQADAGVFVMTETALKSDICGSECLLIRELNKPLYVLRLEACQPENIWLYIKQIQFADLVANFDTGIKSLLSAIEG
ncbi:MAG TPA: toll/interleukin-1 receptor domain-containing protein, partial [Aggregatilineales bacterium]|nr:toll/interleukin-1 receptor domain-containing protein [Aggregatilineales bacterium]